MAADAVGMHRRYWKTFANRETQPCLENLHEDLKVYKFQIKSLTNKQELHGLALPTLY